MDNMIEVYNHIDVWLLIFIRIFFALVFLPIMVETKLPPLAQGGISAVLALLVYMTVPSPINSVDPRLIVFFFMILKEAIIGLIMGFSVLIFFQLYYFIGHLWSVQGGIGMSTLLDPNSGTQMPIIGKFYYLGYATLFLTSGGYHWFIQAVVESFKHIPLGQGLLYGEMMYPIINAVGLFFELGFKLAAPIIGVLFIVDCGLGILARAVPQMNMFVIGVPLKILILFVLLLITIGLMPMFNEMIIKNVVDTFYNSVQGLVP